MTVSSLLETTRGAPASVSLPFETAASPILNSLRNDLPARPSFEPLRSALPTLRQIARRCRELAPLFRGLAVHTTPSDQDLSSFSESVETLAGRANAAAGQLVELLAAQPGADELEDLLALVGMEVQAKQRRLAEILPQPRLPVWEKASVAMGLAAKVLKAATAVENAICEQLEQGNELSLEGEIEDALRVRQAYCKMWSSLLLSPVASSAEVEPRLRTASTAIARLTGREVFLDLRFNDRRLILSMQRRIRRWLASGGQSEGGIQLCQDLLSFFCLLAEINHRIELLVHDEALSELIAILGRQRDEAPLRQEALRRRFELLLGREVALDRILLDQDYDTSAAELLEILHSIATRWRRPDRLELTDSLPSFAEDSDVLDLSRTILLPKESCK